MDCGPFGLPLVGCYHQPMNPSRRQTMKTIVALLALAAALITVPAAADCTGPNCGKDINNGGRETGKGGCTKLGC